MDKNNDFNELLTSAYKRMHRYTCAESSLQALLELWGLPVDEYSWATAGYAGAIMSGKTTCGLLIGSSIAIGFKCRQGKTGRPEEFLKERGKAINAVNRLYNEFLEKFGSSECKEISNVDFTSGEEVASWTVNKGWKKTCDVFLNYIIKKCVSMSEQEIL